MQSDPFVRFLLAVIALALLVQVAEGFGVVGAAEEEEGVQSAIGPYQVTMTRGRRGPIMVRIDTSTGEAWHSAMRGGTWAPIGTGEGAEEAEAEAEAAEAAAPRQRIRLGQPRVPAAPGARAPAAPEAPAEAPAQP